MIAALLLLSIIIVRLPAFYGDELPLWIALSPAALFGAAISTSIAQRPRLHASRGAIFLLILYVGLICIGFFRAAMATTIYDVNGAIVTILVTASLVVFLVFALLADQSERQRRRRWVAVAFAPAAYVAVNVLLHFAGAEPPASNMNSLGRSGTSAQLLGFLGIATERVQFPLSGGINQFGALAGVALGMSIVLAIRSRGMVRAVSALSALCSLYAVLAVDTRGALLFAGAAVAATLLLPGALRQGASGLPLLLPLAPAIVLVILGALAGTAFADVFSRGVGDFSTASGRASVWAIVADFLSTPKLEHLWGYGAYGQITSEVSYSYAYVFVGVPRPETSAAHNFALQTILDVGYIGLVAAVGLLVAAARGAARMLEVRPSAETAAIFTGLLCIAGIAATEAAPAVEYPEAFVGFLPLAVAGLRTAPRLEPEPVVEESPREMVHTLIRH